MLIVIVFTILSISLFSGCTIFDLFGPRFSLDSYSICDDSGFPSLLVSFSCKDSIWIKIFDTNNEVVSKDFFVVGTHNSTLHLDSYMKTISQGKYKLKVYNNDGEKIFEKTISLGGPILSIDTCDQLWWKRDEWKGGYSFVGMNIKLENNGDVPVYPYSAEAIFDSQTYSGYVLPSVIMPNESKVVSCFIYKEDTPENSKFSVAVKDIDGNTLGSKFFSVDFLLLIRKE